MNMEGLCAAVWEAPDWLRRFNRRDYERAFRDYEARFAPLYAQAAAEAGEAGLPDLSDRLLDALEEGWRRQRIWNRAAVRANEKQIMVGFLSPMLLEQADPLCGSLAEVLCSRWAARWPKDAYRTAPYAKIKRGFRNVILGVELPDRAPEEE